MAFTAPEDEVITKDKLVDAVFQQESRGGRMDTSQPNYAGAIGPMQVIKPTFEGLKRQGLIPADYQFENPAHTTAAGKALIGQLFNKFEGDPYKTTAAYYAGENVVRPDGTIKEYRDLKNPKAPTAPQYAEQVVGRVGGAPAAGFSAPAEDLALAKQPVTPAAPPNPLQPPEPTKRMANAKGEMFDVPFANLEEAKTKHGLEFTTQLMDKDNKLFEVPLSRKAQALEMGLKLSGIPEAYSPYEKQLMEQERLKRKAEETFGSKATDWIDKNLFSGGASDIRNILPAVGGAAAAGAGAALAAGARQLPGALRAAQVVVGDIGSGATTVAAPVIAAGKTVVASPAGRMLLKGAGWAGRAVKKLTVAGALGGAFEYGRRALTSKAVAEGREAFGIDE